MGTNIHNLKLLPGLARTYHEGRWPHAEVDRAALVTAKAIDTIDIDGIRHVVFEDDRERRWARPHDHVAAEQGWTWSLANVRTTP